MGPIFNEDTREVAGLLATIQGFSVALLAAPLSSIADPAFQIGPRRPQLLKFDYPSILHLIELSWSEPSFASFSDYAAPLILDHPASGGVGTLSITIGGPIPWPRNTAARAPS